MNLSETILLAPAARKGGVFALGNFDGVHRGHKSVIKAALDKARELNVAPRVLTFEPHPRSLFNPGQAPFRLTPAPVKDRLLRELGISDVAIVPFTLPLSKLAAEEFVNQILLDHYGMQHAVAGFDFVFGHKRQGNMENLRKWLAPRGIGVTEVMPFTDDGAILSSSRTREALEAGDVKMAAHILGRRWSITGPVIKGAQRGRTIGVPTANIALGDYLRPKYGVYAVMAGPKDQATSVKGIANIGVRPTVDGTTELLEVHLFEFEQDIYGQEWTIELQGFIRPEQSFSGLDGLRLQIIKDIEAAQGLLGRP